jgi:hypothetical protein
MVELEDVQIRVWRTGQDVWKVEVWMDEWMDGDVGEGKVADCWLDLGLSAHAKSGP